MAVRISRVVLAVDSTQVKRGRDELLAMQRAGEGAQKSVVQLNSYLKTFATTATVALATRQVVAYSDAWQGANNQLRQVTDSHEELLDVQGKVLAVANETRSGFASTANLYSRLARSTQDLGITQSELIDLTRTINKSFAASGATVQEQAAAITQLSQGLAAGALRGDEFNSVAEQAPGLMRAIAKETKLTIGELREFAATGGITAEIVVNALRNSAETIDNEFGRSVATFGQKWTVAQNNMTEFVGNSSSVNGAVSDLGDGIVKLSENLDDVADAVVLVGTVMAARFAGPVAGAFATATAAAIVYEAKVLSGSVVTLGSANAAKQKAAATLASAEADTVAAAAAVRSAQADVASARAKVGLIAVEVEFHQVIARTAALESARVAAISRVIAAQSAQAAAAAALTKAEASLATAETAATVAANAQTAATGRLAAATAAAAPAAIVLTTAMRGLSAAVAFVGGPFGLLVLAASAVFAFREELGLVKPEAQKASEGVDILTKSIDGLSDAQKRLRLSEIEEEIKRQRTVLKDYAMLAEEAASASSRISGDKSLLGSGGVFTEVFDRQALMLEARRDDAKLRLEQLIELSNKLRGIIPDKPKDTEKPVDKSDLALLREQNFLLALGVDAKQASLQVEEKRLRMSLAAKKYTQDEINAYVYLTNSVRALTEAQEIAANAREEDQADMLSLAESIEQIRGVADPAYEQLGSIRDQANTVRRAFAEGLIDQDAALKLIAHFDKLAESVGKVGDGFESMGKSSIESLRTMQGVFDRGSRGYKELEVAIQLANTSLAIHAILNQAAGTNPYESFARMATMAAAVGSLVGSIGGLGGSFSDTAGSRQATQGTGTVYGMWSDQSQSIANAVEITANATSELVGINRSMLSALTSLQQGIAGAAGQVSGELRGTSFNYGGQIDINGNVFRGASQAIFGGTNTIGLADKAMGGVMSGLFNAIGRALGGSSQITDQGVEIVGGTVSELIGNTLVRAYQETQYKKYAWSSTKTATVTSALDDAISMQFSLIFESIADSVSASAIALGMSGNDIERAINQYQIETKKISLLGLNAEEQQKQIEAVFSSVFDGLVQEVLPFASDFQRIGEGLGETLVRIATNAQVTDQAVARLGFTAEKLGTEQFARLSTELIDLAGGLESFISGMSKFVDLFATDAKKFSIAQSDLSTALQAVGLSTPATRSEMWALMQTLDAGTDAGRKQIAALLSLSSVADTYYDQLEKAQQERQQRISSEVNAITNALASLRNQYAPTAGMARQNAMSALQRALVTGDFTGVGQAAGVAANVDSSQFRTLAEFQIEQARTLYLLGSLEQAGAGQLDVAERSASYLENIDANIAAMTGDSPAVIAGGSEAMRKQEEADAMLSEMRELKAYLRQVVINSGESRDIIYRWNRDGLPEERDA